LWDVSNHSTLRLLRRIPLNDSPPPVAPDPAVPGDAALVAIAQDAIIVRDLRDRVVFWNRGAQTLYGWSRREAAGLVSHELLRSRFLSHKDAASSSIRATGDWEGLVYHQTRDRKEVAVWTRWTAVRDTDGSVLSVVQADRDVTWLADLVESAADAIIVIGRERRIVLFNRAAADLFAMSSSEAIDQSIERFLPEGIADLLVGSPADGPSSMVATSRRVVDGRRTDGSVLTVEATIVRTQPGGQPLTTLVLRDGSGVRRLEEHLRETQRVEAIGRLAGGIAHDFNNLLSTITGHLEFVRSAVDPSAMDDLDEITSAAYRASQLARQLLVFSRSQVTRPRFVKPNEIIQTSAELLRRVIGPGVHLELDLDPDVPGVRVDPAQLEQALVSLVINASDAMPNGGTLTVATRSADVFGGRGEPRAVSIEVSDTGVGMDDRTRRRAVEPFFTTKTSEGAGLGLAAVQGVATQAGGSVSITSAPGAGTRVSITLPVPDDLAERDETDSWSGTGPRAGRGRVLLVEDDVAVRTVARRLLQREGHTVIEARTGEHALQRWREITSTGDRISVVVTDVVMPDMGGRELIAQLRAVEPKLPVVYVSAYLADAVSGLDLSGPAELLEKPFSAASLNAAVDAVLGPGEDIDRR
jgi:PAS domain S-box-containing protein